VTTSRDPGGEPEVRSYPFGPPDALRIHPYYEHLREQEPVSRVRLPYGGQAWLAVRYADVRTVMGDPRFSRAAALTRDEPRLGPTPLPAGILTMDPPEHSRLRRLVAKAFTVRRTEQLRGRAQEITDGLLDAMIAAGPPADLVPALARPLPVAVICELLGVPFADRGDFELWSRALLTLDAPDSDQIRAYLRSLRDYMAGLVEQRRQAPTDDLIGALVLARDEQDRLSEEELVSLCIGLLAAGHETTANQIGNFVVVLLTNPDQLHLLRDRPDLLPSAVEELLRYVPMAPSAAVPRWATEDVELSDGTIVRAGEAVLPARTVANRDPAVFADPERVDITRSPNPHLGFGHGVHHCLGAQLARVELQVALGALLARCPDLRLAVAAAELAWRPGMAIRGPLALPVTW
jgi:cytochrome P450